MIEFPVTPMQRNRLRLLIDAACRIDFPTFIGKSFHTLLPSSPYHQNWHIYALAYHLELVRTCKIKRLIVNIAPRSLKSLVCSVAWPAYMLGLDPTARIVTVSYGADLAIKHANDSRTIMNAPWYRRTFTQTRISPTKNTETEIVTTRQGFRLVTSIDGSLMGRGGNFVIVDDPLKPNDAHLASKRQRVNDWLLNTALGRLDDKQNGAFVIVMQRLHVDDLVAAALRNSDEWTVLNLPAIAVRDEDIPIGDNKYHHRSIGDVLHEAREPRRILDSLRVQLGPEVFEAQYQQNPVPQGGDMIKRDWVRRYNRLPVSEESSPYIVQSWDTASKDSGQNDYSVCTTWLIHEQKYYLVDVLRERFNYPTLKATAIDHAAEHKPAIILIEDAGVGTALVAELQQAGLAAVAVAPTHDKRTRMAIQSAKFASGQVRLPNAAPWLAELELELFTFPNALHDDQVDSISQALAHEVSADFWTEEALEGMERLATGIWKAQQFYSLFRR